MCTVPPVREHGQVSPPKVEDTQYPTFAVYHK